MQRTYYTTHGPRLWRIDELHYGGPQGKLSRVEYRYVRQSTAQRVLESGLLDFKPEPLRAAGTAPSEASSLQHDKVARHTTGRPQPLLTYTYDAQGQVLAATSPLSTRSTYQYDAAGHCTQVQQFQADQLVQVTRYTYCPMASWPAPTCLTGATGLAAAWCMLTRITNAVLAPRYGYHLQAGESPKE